MFCGDVIDVYNLAEEFNQQPYAVNVFPTGKEKVELKTISVEGNIVVTNCHTNSDGEIIIRIYNPSEKEEKFTVNIGGNSVSGYSKKGEVVSVIFEHGKGKVIIDKMPV